MGAVHIRDLPEQVIEALKRRAAANDRSLQKELRHILCAVAAESLPSEVPPELTLKLSDAPAGGTWSREEIYGDGGR